MSVTTPSPEAPGMIRLENVSKSYRAGDVRKVLLDNVTLELPRGRSVGLLGRNGAGKSTLLRMIGGAVEPDVGRIFRDATISWPLGFGGGFHGALTGAQNVRFIARIYGMDTDAMIDFVEDFAEIGPFMHMPVSTYSSGMRARLAFGVSMGIDFDVYLIDEIVAVGDSAFKKKCRQILNERAKTSDIIMVSHSMADVQQFCNCAIVLEQGNLNFFDNVNDAIAAHENNMNR